MTKKLLLLLVAFSLASPTMMLAGCNTVEGAGKDVQAGGKAIKNEAAEHKTY